MGKSDLAVLFSIGMYLLSSITSVFVNKYVLMDDVIDTVLLILLQHLSCLLFLFLFKKYLTKLQNDNNTEGENFSLYEGIKHMWLLIISFNFTLILGNICLKYTNISSYQLARSMTLPFNFFFSYFYFKQIKFNILMICSCILVSIGFFIFSIDAVNTNYRSVLYGTTVSIIQAIHLNLLKQKLLIYKNKMIMLRYNLIYSSIILFIYLTITRDIFAVFNLNYRAAFFLFLSCVSAICVTFSSFLCIYYTDNVVYNMFGNVKSTMQTFLSKYYNSEHLNLYTMIGIIFTTLGSFIYTYSCEYTKKKKKELKKKKKST
ncbi:GDP-fructose:GMP antiporter, putative [Plasmodium malariae]|uniref:GDP-fructose:GMP antiporter, putative n=1 Tax=Plasmodium malariae TaxID=5858 RepID=A0A1D3JJ45_PLAMA|nr:GDP-fructose:GMP antiporter, putative [Plasmodium malariae]SBT86508.1 GDP-fructose:GMP antiporter, putative [Plasmodium malariae]